VGTKNVPIFETGGSHGSNPGALIVLRSHTSKCVRARIECARTSGKSETILSDEMKK